MHKIGSLLAARLFVSPQVVGDRIFFMSNMSGHLSLYAMDYGGSVPEPLLPPQLALQNPHLIGGKSFYVFPDLAKILLMIDQDGDEKYQPALIPIDGGYPEFIFQDVLGSSRVHMGDCDPDQSIVYFNGEALDSEYQTGYRANLSTMEITKLASSQYGAYPATNSKDHRRVVLADGYTMGDDVLYLWVEGVEGRKLIFGKPIEQRESGEQIKLSGINSVNFLHDTNELLVSCAIFTDKYSPALIDLSGNGQPIAVSVKGLVHKGNGELEGLDHLAGDRFLLVYNIDGCSWMYEAIFNRSSMTLEVQSVILGNRPLLSNGMVFSYSYDKAGDRFAISFSTATSPTQIYTVEGKDREVVRMHTREKVLGLSNDLLSPGEDASFTSFDGTPVSARLYLPAEALGYQGKRPLVYYIHGGPQGQERPDFGWFSMPLIQYLTLNGFAVFVPNVRGSTGYGLDYTKQVDRDWGGKDRLDHVHALKVLSKDTRLDVKRSGVVGRSYGGYMTLTLAGRHPDLWSAAVDMFGPFDLLTFSERIPETWKPYFKMALGDPETERDFLIERSPKTYIANLECPLLVIQGKNDPRVVEKESRDLVEFLRAKGKTVDYLMFENEGHDVLKYENRVRCYETITDFFTHYLTP